jgi:glyoxylase-like metal-dependent hydrolase (beta-lactamase superfamily II)
VEAEPHALQADADTPAEVVRPGLWSLRVPIPDNPLGYTLVYLFETGRGPVLVDTGWPHPASWDALLDGIVRTGHRVEDVYGVLSTHHHDDHHGLAGRVREVSGAWVAMHEADARAVERRGMADEDWYRLTRAMMVEAGAPEEDLAALPKPTEVRRHFAACPDRLLDDGEQADVPGWTLAAVWTPGHTPGHLCFAEHTHQLLLSGDHLLPDLTPHIGLRGGTAAGDPLADYLASLHRLASSAFREVLPAHQHRFADAAARARALVDHHERRLASVLAIVAVASGLTAWEVAGRMEWNRPWSAFGVRTRCTALTEACAHLRHLEVRGLVLRGMRGRVPTWTATAAGYSRVRSVDYHAGILMSDQG